jgi:hypothetical protein
MNWSKLSSVEDSHNATFRKLVLLPSSGDRDKGIDPTPLGSLSELASHSETLCFEEAWTKDNIQNKLTS